MSEIIRKIHVDASDRVITFAGVQDCEPIIEHNKRMQTQQQTGDWRLEAFIPAIVEEQWLNEEWNRGNMIQYMGKEWMQLLERKLADP